MNNPLAIADGLKRNVRRRYVSFDQIAVMLVFKTEHRRAFRPERLTAAPTVDAAERRLTVYPLLVVSVVQFEIEAATALRPPRHVRAGIGMVAGR